MDIPFLQHLDFWIKLFSSFATLIASGLAIYIYCKNRKNISSAINTLLNYSKQITLSELKLKIEKLNDFTTEDKVQKVEIINILSEIQGQVIANKAIENELKKPLLKVGNFIAKPEELTEPKKRSLVSELRESVRNIDISNYKSIVK